MGSGDIGGFQEWDIKKVQLVTFLAVFSGL